MEMPLKIIVNVKTPLDGEHQEKFEDCLKKAVSDFGICATIKSSTGNEISINGSGLNHRSEDKKSQAVS